MATLYDWQKYINVLHELALVEDDLRYALTDYSEALASFADRVLYERFGAS